MSERNISRAAGAVSLGSLLVQAGGVLGQFLYAIWLTPADFGLWATASASVALLGAFTNGGEANAYLAGKRLGISATFKRSQLINIVLAAVTTLLALIIAVIADPRVALLIVLLAIGIPLQGRGAMLVAVFIKVRNRSALIMFQAISTCFRLVVGVCVASIWQSPLALALAHLTYALVLVVIGQIWIKLHGASLLKASSASAGTWTLRIDRALHQVSQVLPHQIGYLTVSLLASAQLLGLFFFAYQATSAISGVLASPLSKATMSELSRVGRSQRVAIVSRFLILTIALVGTLTALVSVIVQPVSSLVGDTWQGVFAPFVILLASLPARFVFPVTEALYMVDGKWRRSMFINLLDAFGVATSAFIALKVLNGDVILLAVAITMWKVLYGNYRAFITLPGKRLIVIVAVIVPNTLFPVITAISVISLGYFHWIAFLTVVAIALFQLLLYKVSRRTE